MVGVACVMDSNVVLNETYGENLDIKLRSGDSVKIAPQVETIHIDVMEQESFVKYLIRKHYSAYIGRYYEDMYQEGMYAVAYEKSRLDGTTFVSNGEITLKKYVATNIGHRVRRNINDMLAKSVRAYGTSSHTLDNIRNLIAEFGPTDEWDEKTVKKIKDKFGYGDETIARIIKWSNASGCSDKVHKDGVDMDVIDLQMNKNRCGNITDESISEVEMRASIDKVISELSEKERNIITKLMNGYTPADIARQEGVSRQWAHLEVQKIRKKIKDKIYE